MNLKMHLKGKELLLDARNNLEDNIDVFFLFCFLKIHMEIFYTASKLNISFI